MSAKNLPVSEVLAALIQVADLYAKMRALAQSQGVTDAQLAEADARFRTYYPDPLAGEKTQADATAWRFESHAEAAAAMRAAGLDYLVIRFADGDYGIWPKGVGPVPGEIVG